MTTSTIPVVTNYTSAEHTQTVADLFGTAGTALAITSVTDYVRLWNTRSLQVNNRRRPYVEMEGWPSLIGGVYLPSTSAPVGRTAAGLPRRPSSVAQPTAHSGRPHP